MFLELISAFIGICFIIISIIKTRENKYLSEHGIIVTGVVFALNREKRSYFPVVRFRTKEDYWITKQLDYGSNPSFYKEGESVELVYDPADPEKVILSSEATFNILPRVFGLIGLALVIRVILTLLDLI